MHVQLLFAYSIFSSIVYTLTVYGETRPRVEVDIVFFGYPGADSHTFAPGHSQYSISGPSYELAVEELQRRYNDTFQFNFIHSSAHTCLNVVQEPNDVLAAFYYRQWRADKVMGFVNPGWEPGLRHYYCL